ncbi:uncharacterized protein RCC_11457 [Ramularia collo-cygni]|uniref:Apple domain-containing protein n=1 Tax=Ramularia collo-cygni TaxID=112498 RepID=A0A2D3VC78_9PEZI|nr:uncharacterized protein RCC_11457 [Ramularia collo-cygni]CZT25788.1 uncharacterized protein RCC_11457 [Ramularia collo-cygni]
MLLVQLPRTVKLAGIVAVVLTILLISSCLARIGETHIAGTSLSTGGEADEGEKPTAGSLSVEPLPCRRLPGVDDVLVVMRTGASEIRDKLPIHYDTTFRCYGDVVIFSDHEEDDFRGRRVHNVLADMPQQVINTHMDFMHYRHIQQVGREGLHASELSGGVSEEVGKFGKNNNAGWRLDKWKFLPMINRTLEMYPTKKWYLFVEPDTYVVWSNFLRWIQELDPSKPAYYGSENLIGEDLFAHGGSAFLLSRPALQNGVEVYRSNTTGHHAMTGTHWAGDCVLGITLKEAGVPLTWTWPMFQGGNPSDQMQFEQKKGKNTLWCSPVLSYHHFTPEQVADLWKFEQDWIQSLQDRKPSFWSDLAFWKSDHSSILHHREVFKHFVMPELMSERVDWTNSPETYHPGTEDATMEECRARCAANAWCMQYALGPAGCFTGKAPRIGRAQEGFRSQWMTQRLEIWMGSLDRCRGKEGWTVT